jgi:NitT/TauT family transport system substrate-binding protein
MFYIQGSFSRSAVCPLSLKYARFVRNWKRRRKIIAPTRKKIKFILIALSVLLHACVSGGEVQPTLEPATLKVLLLPYLNSAPLFIAAEEGYFTEQGLEIEFVKMERSAEAVPALAEGELDMLGGVAVSSSLLNAIARGAEIRFVADQGYFAATGCDYGGLAVKRTLVETGELDSPSRLRGRRVAINPVALPGYYLAELLSTASLTIEDVEIVDIPNPAKLEALEKGMVDVAYAAEPWITRILQTGQATLWMPVQEVTPDFPMAFIVYGPTLLEENPDAGRRFIVAYLRAVRQYNQGKTERNLDILAEHTGLDRELLMQACWPSIRDDGQINVQGILDFQAWAVEKGYLDSPVTEEQFWDPSFVEHANEVLNTPSQ